ncbi:hypothetical protein HBI34_062530 [Parastagonospora nodorum]|nr:hypothetical protein HBI34_062530 [Parastagonospora nodorum]
MADLDKEEEAKVAKTHRRRKTLGERIEAWVVMKQPWPCTTSAPEVRRVPDYMGSWAVGELDECVSDTIRARGRALSDESYTMAEAMEAKDGQTSSQHATYRPGPTPGLRSCIRGHNGATGAKHKNAFQFSQPALVTQAVTGFSSEIRR